MPRYVHWLSQDFFGKIVPKHIEFQDDYIKIFLPRSKTDIYREGNCIYISVSSSKYCPVGILRRYLNLSGTDSNSTLPLFRPLTFHPSNSSYTLTTGKMSYSRCREILRDCLSKLGYNPNDYALHSGAPYSWNMVNLFLFGCHVTDRAYVRTYVRTYVRVYRLYG